MDALLTQRILPDVKSCLDITWDDPGTDRKISGWTQAGINYLDSRAGEQMEYARGSSEWALLMEFVRYARDGALDVFESNYLHLILSMQTERRLIRESGAIPAEQSDFSGL